MNPNQPNFCPACGAKAFNALSIKEYRCAECGYRLFHNTAAAVAAMIVVGSEVLLAQRASEPAKGLYDFPGGFVDPDESQEAALARELYEELKLEVTPSQFEYMFSDHNTYEYQGVVYKTSDSFFVLRLDSKPLLQIQDDVTSAQWCELSMIDTQILAFDGVKRAIDRLGDLINTNRK